MGVTAGILTAVSTGAKFLEERRQGDAAKAQGTYAQAVDNENARIADLQATDATQRGQLDANRTGLATRQNIGATRAAQAASGVDIGSGSAADVRGSEAALGALDEMTIRNNAAREAWGYNVEATQYRKQGQMAALAGDQAAKGYQAESYGTLLTGASNLYGIYQSHQTNAGKTDLRTSGNRTGGAHP